MKIVSNLATRAAVLTGLAIGAFALVALADWNSPTQAPPNGNADAPINVGASSQAKTGTLNVGTDLQGVNTGGWLDAGSLGIWSSNFVFSPGGSTVIKPGQVLTARDSSGDVVWADPTGGGGSTSAGETIFSINSSSNSSKSAYGSKNNATVVTFPAITPNSVSSKFLINANAVVGNGSGSGDCQVYLYRNGVNIAGPYASINLTNYDAVPIGITYVDAPSMTGSVTYKVTATGNCSINEDGKGAYFGISTMSAIEYGQ